MALQSKGASNAKPATVEPTDRLLKLNVQEYVKGADGKPVENPVYTLVEKLKAKAEEVAQALGGTRNVKYEVSPYTKDGEDRVSCSIRFAGFGPKVDKKANPDAKRATQTITLSVKAEDMSISYFGVTDFDSTAKKPVKVDFNKYFDDTKEARKKLEDAGLIKAFEPKQREASELDNTPEGKIYSAAIKAANEASKTAEKTPEGKNKYYLGELKDTSFETQKGEKVEQKSFDINAHSDQKVTVNIQGAEIASMTVYDFSNYDKEKGNKDDIERVNIYKPDYFEKLDALDAGLKQIALSLDFKGREKSDKEAEGEFVNIPQGISEEIPYETTNDDLADPWADDFADR